MKIKAKLQESYDIWKDEREKEGRTEFVTEMVTVAAQVDDWIDRDGLSPDVAFGRIVRDKPYLVHPMSPTGIHMRTALGEFWSRGEEFVNFVSARMASRLDEPTGEQP